MLASLSERLQRSARGARSVGFTLACALAGLGLTPAAQAQQVVARVNGEVVTAVEVAQRTRLLQLSTQKAPSRTEVINELIEEQLKIQAARRYRVEIADAEVDQVIAGMASRMRTDPQRFAQSLSAAGVGINSLRRKLRADMAWNNIVRGKFQASLQVRDKDVADVVLSRKSDKDAAAVDYSLRPILFVVPRGSPETVWATRRRDAEALRTRFQGCDEGLRLARGLRDVAVRDAMTRTSTDLTAKLREVLDGIPVGKLSPPDVTPNGIEVFAVCSKQPAKVRSASADREAREELFGQKFTAQGKQYLQQLRRTASIQIQ